MEGLQDIGGDIDDDDDEVVEDEEILVDVKIICGVVMQVYESSLCMQVRL